MSDWFSRVPMRWRPLVEEVRDFIPQGVAELVQPRFLIGISPRFVGLHYYDMSEQPDEYRPYTGSWTYDDVAHACYAIHCSQPTIVFPKPALYGNPVATILHEWGHLFDEATGFSLDAPVTTPYSRINRVERIAEAIEILSCPPSGAWQDYVSAESFRPLREAIGVA